MINYRILMAIILVSCKRDEVPQQKVGVKNVRNVAVLSGLVLRDSPSRSGRQIALIPFRSSLQIEETDVRETVNGTSGFWSKTSHEGKQGFVFGGYLTNESFYTEIERYPNADGSALAIVEHTTPTARPDACRNTYGRDNNCKIKIFAQGLLVHSIEGENPSGWIDNDRFAYGSLMGEHGWRQSGYSEYSVTERDIIRSYGATTNNPGEGDPAMAAQSTGPSAEFTVCAKRNCTSVNLKDHFANISGASGSFQQKYQARYSLGIDIDEIVITLDDQCWRKVSRITGAVAACNK